MPSRPNIAALRSIGVRTIIAFSAVGSLREEVRPRDFLVPDQIIDRTKGVRPWTFFEEGMVGHVGFADPFDEKVALVVRSCGHSLEGEGVRLHDRGTLVCMGTSLVTSSLPSHRLKLIIHFNPYRRTAIQHPSREQPLPQLGWKRDQHVRAARSETSTRSGNRLPDDLHVHRLRLLAS